ncbi:MAG: hypothetical protein DRI95_08055 [Bacteroidetes bacterium]|nr:MAG: hypothetical protein DRI95_08055 [Bacteroidota bacterium]
MRKIILLLISITFSVTNLVNAQIIASGENNDNDSIECLKGISVYKEFQKLKFIDKAIPEWEKVYRECPGYKKIIYQDGVKFLRYSIKKEKEQVIKKALVDSLMMIYDKRIKYFGEEDYLKGKKGLDLLRYDNNRIEEARQLLYESKEGLAEKTGASVLNSLMASTEILYKKNKLTDTAVVKTYLSSVEILEKQLQLEKKDKKIKRINAAINSIENVFSKSKAASCENLVPALTNKFNNDNENLELILKIQVLLKAANCIKSDLYYQTALKLHELKPNANNAYILAGLSFKKEKYKETCKYLEESVEMETSDSLKAQYYFDLGIINYKKLKNYQQARSYAYEAIKLRKNWGKPYLLIGDIYAAYSPNYGETGFEHSTLYWAAVDQYKKAKMVDSTFVKTANEKIEYYRQHFPNGEDAFFYGFAKGQNYKVGGWINETTVVRTR